MQKCLEKFIPADIIAIIIIIGSLLLKLKGFDGTVSMILIGICFYYFGKTGNPFFRVNVQPTNEPK